MVVKLLFSVSATAFLFESDVILYGGQTTKKELLVFGLFESDVILYGGQTLFE